MNVTESGIFKEVKAVQNANALCPIDFNPDGKTTVTIGSWAKAWYARPVTG